MLNNTPIPTATVAENGHVFVTQGYYHQAFFIARHELPRFLADPKSAAVVLIPPFASTALECYVANTRLMEIQLKRDLTVSEDFSLIFQLPSRRVAYFSDPEELSRPSVLANKGIEVAVTPQALAVIDGTRPKPAVAIVAGLPRPENANYPCRFSCNPQRLRECVEDALSHAHPLIYEN